jgi:hypothetical protein
MKTKITAAGHRVTITRAPDGLWRWESDRPHRLCAGLASLTDAIEGAQRMLGRDVTICHSPEAGAVP